MDARPRAKLVMSLLGGRPGRALDVGCGKGLLLAQLRDAGWKVEGTELSEVSSRFARSLGVNVFQGPVQEAPVPAESFDVVTLFHVLEHLTDPKGALAHICRLLRPGGSLVVEVPNIGSWYARLFGDLWFHYDVPRHLYHFNRVTLRRMLVESGFDVVTETTRNFQYDAFGAVQSALNRVLHKRNLLNNFNTGELRFSDLLHGPNPVRDVIALAVSQVALGIGFPLLVVASAITIPWRWRNPSLYRATAVPRSA
jgi:SAM-dependent methyltransferase